MKKTTTIQAAGLALMGTALLSCGAQRPSTDPGAMSETDHRERAEAERRAADAHAARYDTSGVRRAGGSGDRHEGIAGGDYPNLLHPSDPGTIQDNGAYHLDAARRRRELARQHEEAADALVSFESAQCEAIPAHDRSSCPLLTSVQSVALVDGGVALALRDGRDPERVLAHARCHAAFGRRHGREGMDRCPLYVQGVSVTLSEGQLLLTAPDEGAVEQVRERSAAHVTAPAL